MDNELYPETREEFTKLRTQGAGEDFSTFNGKDIFSYFRSGEDVLNASPPNEIIETTGIMGKHDLPQIPHYFCKVKGDEVSTIEDNDALVKHYCDQDISSLQCVRNSMRSHTSESMVGSAGVVGFLKDRFESIAAVKVCDTKNPRGFDPSLENPEIFGSKI